MTLGRSMKNDLPKDMCEYVKQSSIAEKDNVICLLVKRVLHKRRIYVKRDLLKDMCENVKKSMVKCVYMWKETYIRDVCM